MQTTYTNAEAGTAKDSRKWPNLPFATTPVSENWPLGKVRCVGRWNGEGDEEYLINVKWWARNQAGARRYASQSAAKMIATKYGGIVLRYHRDNCGNYYLRPVG